MSTVYRVKVPYAGEWLTSNKTSRYQHGSKGWRDATAVACRAAKLPQGLTPVTIHALAYYTGRAPVRDLANLYPTIKACVDGCTPLRISTRNGKRHTRGGYGLIPDDSDRHVIGLPTWELRRSDTQPYLLLEITHHDAVEHPDGYAVRQWSDHVYAAYILTGTAGPYGRCVGTADSRPAAAALAEQYLAGPPTVDNPVDTGGAA